MGSEVIVNRIALNMDQIDELDLPPNPAKLSDSRAAEYIKKYGTDSWELDALRPQHMHQLINEAVEGHIDRDVWDATVEKETVMRNELRAIGNNWDELKVFIKDNYL